MKGFKTMSDVEIRRANRRPWPLGRLIPTVDCQVRVTIERRKFGCVATDKTGSLPLTGKVGDLKYFPFQSKEEKGEKFTLLGHLSASGYSFVVDEIKQ